MARVNPIVIQSKVLNGGGQVEAVCRSGSEEGRVIVRVRLVLRW